jgi:hypothetical protein
MNDKEVEADMDQATGVDAYLMPPVKGSKAFALAFP